MESLIASYLGDYLDLFLVNFDLKRDLNVRISKADANVTNLGKVPSKTERTRSERERVKDAIFRTCLRDRRPWRTLWHFKDHLSFNQLMTFSLFVISIIDFFHFIFSLFLFSFSFFLKIF